MVQPSVADRGYPARKLVREEGRGSRPISREIVIDAPRDEVWSDRRHVARSFSREVRGSARQRPRQLVTREGEEAERLWAAIADPTRQQLIDLMLAKGEATATDLARDLPVTRQGVAKHLAVMERAGLVEASRVGREVRFTVRQDRLDQATRRMARIAAQWDEGLAKIKRIAETDSDAH